MKQDSAMQSQLMLRSILAVFVLTTVSFAFLGFGFFLIVFGGMMTLFRLSFYWEPARRLVYKLTLLKETHPFTPPTLPWWSIIIQGINILVTLAIAGFGIYLLFKYGFLDQNFIYLIFFR